MNHDKPSSIEASPLVLSLNKPDWSLAAQSRQKSVRQWAVSALDAAAASESFVFKSNNMLDNLVISNLADGSSPFPFQVTAIRHWIGFTQSRAAELIDTRLSTYRNCESIDECVLMDVDRWRDYVSRATNHLSSTNPQALPNAFGRAIRGLCSLTYRQLNDISSLSQSYWTTRLRFKDQPAPIEVQSIDELLKVVIQNIESKFNEGLTCEGFAMLKTLLYLALETQKVKVKMNPSLISPMHIINNNYHDDIDIGAQLKPSFAYKKHPENLMDSINLYARTIYFLSLSGYVFSNNHKAIDFVNLVDDCA